MVDDLDDGGVDGAPPSPLPGGVLDPGPAAAGPFPARLAQAAAGTAGGTAGAAGAAAGTAGGTAGVAGASAGAAGGTAGVAGAGAGAAGATAGAGSGAAGVSAGGPSAAGPSAAGPSEPRFVRAGDCGLYALFPQVVDPAVNRQARRLARAVMAARWPGVIDVVPSYAAVYIQFDPVTVTFDRLVNRCRELLGAAAGGEPEETRICVLPTAYGGPWGPDLEAVARFHGLEPEEVIRRHAGRDYFVYFLGFSPGFPFLGGLDPRLATPRRSTPRTRVPAGSVGIAGEQTGVYPVESPGGWNLIGRTPVRLFDPAADPPTLLRPGDYVRFVPVDGGTFERIAEAVARGTYRPQWLIRDEPAPGSAAGPAGAGRPATRDSDPEGGASAGRP
ncbi:5-oxoprolinase subunit PxpB [Thermaerobacter litoralis]